MDEELSDKLLNFVRTNFFIISLFALGLIMIAVGVFQMMGQNKAEVTFESGKNIADVSASQGQIKVDVEGQVIHPGVYTLENDARVQDALIAAGGLSPNADRNSINLAAKITDGQKIYIQAIGEEVKGASAQSKQISLNSASQTELESLPGIGSVSALKVIDGRPYNSIEDLINKKVVGKATYEKIKDLVTL